MFLAQEGLDAARAIRDSAWTDLVVGNHGLSRISGAWSFSGTSEAVGNKYTRAIIVEDTNRSAYDGDILSSGGVNYGRTKKVTSRITWFSDDIARTVSAASYLTDWNVFDWFQTSRDEFLSGTFSNASTTGAGTGADIILSTTQSWTNAGGSFFTHQSSGDFSGGTFNNTALIGTGNSAHVDIATSTSWASAVSPTTQDLNAVYFVSSIDGWAAGLSGKIERWDGISWSEFLDTGATAHKTIYLAASCDG